MHKEQAESHDSINIKEPKSSASSASTNGQKQGRRG